MAMGEMYYKMKEIWIEKWNLLKTEKPKEYKKLLIELKMNDKQAMTCEQIKITRVAPNLHSLLNTMSRLNL